MTDMRDPGVREAVTRLALSSPPAPTFDELASDPIAPVVQRIPAWTAALGAAAAVLIVIGGASFLLGGSDGSADQAPVVQATTVVPVPTTIAEDVVAGWNPILSGTVAGVAPKAATCPPGATPDLPGAADQVRPGEGPWSNQAAVFDVHTGRIVFLDESAVTWTFDVCTNTWERMDTTYGGSEVGLLVYDIDSDRTIAFSPDGVSVYNSNTNSWTQRASPSDIASEGFWLGSVYDSVSGLVLVVAGDGVLVTYDVDTDTWTQVGRIIEERDTTFEGQTQTIVSGFLVGHIAETDRLVFLGFDGAPFQDEGRLLNPRTGETAPLEEPDGGVWGGFGAFRYATGGETAYTFGDGVCRLDPTALSWDCVEFVLETEGPSALVYDPINDRVVLINDHCCNWPGRTVTDAVQAIDFNTGERIELLPTANTRTETDGS